MIGVGVWILVDKNFMQAVYGNVLMTVAAYLIVVGECFLCQLTCQSADIISSLCGVGVHVRVRVNNFSSKTTRPRDVLFFLKDTLFIEDEKCSRHANLSVRLFARDITRGVPPPKVWKFQHLITIFSVTIAGISLISCLYVLDQR